MRDSNPGSSAPEEDGEDIAGGDCSVQYPVEVAVVVMTVMVGMVVVKAARCLNNKKKVIIT